MVTTKDLITKLKAVKEERNLSYGDILSLIESKGQHVSKTSLVRIFAEDSEDKSFMQETILPVANALLDIDNIEDEDNTEERAMKVLLRYKSERIAELEVAIAKEESKYHEKMDAERAQYNSTINFLKEQISLKDKRMDFLLEAVHTKDSRYDDLLDRILDCPYMKEKGK